MLTYKEFDLVIAVIFFPSKSVASFVQIDCLTRKLAEVDLGSCIKGKNNVMSLRESEALAVIKQLQDQVC